MPEFGWFVHAIEIDDDDFVIDISDGIVPYISNIRQVRLSLFEIGWNMISVLM